MSVRFSFEEAASIAGRSEFEIRKVLDADAVRSSTPTADHTPRYQFAAHDILYLKLINDLPLTLRKEDQNELWIVVLRKQGSAGHWHWSDEDLVFDAKGVRLPVDVKRVRSSIARRLRTFLRGRDRVVSRPPVLGGGPVFRGTRILLAHIARLFAKGVPLEEIREDYPALSQCDLDYAVLVDRMDLRVRQPHKPLNLVREGRSITTNERPAVMREVSFG